MLEDVTLPENITKIGSYAFSECSSLKSITIPGSVKKIDYNAFERCEELTDVYFGGTEEEWKKVKIGSYNYAVSDENIHFNEAPVKDDTIGVIVYGSKVKFDQEPFIEDGRTLVPLRAIFEALGATVEWDEKTSTVKANGNNVEIELQIGSKEMKVGNEVKILDVPAKIAGGRTMVPVRAISEAFGCNVEWDAETRTVIVSGDNSVA